MRSWTSYYRLILLFTGLLYLPVLSAQTDSAIPQPVLDINERFEKWQMSLLAQVQSRGDVSVHPFTTDGCSGGLSEGWEFIAGVIPAFAERYGDKPPWEACCVEHDRAYWQGATEDGFHKRLVADQTLQQCVVAFGQQHSTEYADKYQLDVQEVEEYFNIAADLMFRAVRLGGKPCSFLPWRWGYGWPHCTPALSPSGE